MGELRPPLVGAAVGTLALGAGCICLLARAPRAVSAQTPAPSTQVTPKPPASGTTPATPTTGAAGTATPIVGSLSFGPAGGLPFSLAPKNPPTLDYVITCNDHQSFKGRLVGSGTIQYPDVPPGTICTVKPTPAPGLSDVVARSFPPVPAGGVSSVAYLEGSPQIAVSPPDGPPGRPTTVYGTGFPPDHSVTVTWPANLGAPVTAITSATGQLVMSIYVLPNSPLGDLDVVASGTGFSNVSAAYLVVAPTVEASGPQVQVAFRP